jgi:hypothetical protein
MEILRGSRFFRFRRRRIGNCTTGATRRNSNLFDDPLAAYDGAMKRRLRFATWWRYARFLAREFRWPLGVFLAIVLGGGLLVHLRYTAERLDYAEACYGVFLLVFMQPELKFPEEAYLRPLWFLIPAIGLGAVADSVVRLGYFIFSRKQHLQEWQIMEASAMRDHTIVIGVGKVGYRILLELNVLRLEAVGVERKS